MLATLGTRRKHSKGYEAHRYPAVKATNLNWSKHRMKVEEIAEVVAKLPPDQLARFRRWFTAFEAGRTDHAKELDSAATKLGRLAGRAFAELKKRAKEPRE
jgi:hypothetical protein